MPSKKSIYIMITSQTFQTLSVARKWQFEASFVLLQKNLNSALQGFNADTAAAEVNESNEEDLLISTWCHYFLPCWPEGEYLSSTFWLITSWLPNTGKTHDKCFLRIEVRQT